MAPRSVRAAGINTLRQARNGRELLEKLEDALGHRIEIMSGREEARPIYFGVAHTQDETEERRLVVDVGGGSTEAVIGERFAPIEADSLSMGCITFTERFFPGGQIRAKYGEAAQVAAALELQSLEKRYRRLGWSRTRSRARTSTTRRRSSGTPASR